MKIEIKLILLIIIMQSGFNMIEAAYFNKDNVVENGGIPGKFKYIFLYNFMGVGLGLIFKKRKITMRAKAFLKGNLGASDILFLLEAGIFIGAAKTIFEGLFVNLMQEENEDLRSFNEKLIPGSSWLIEKY